METNEKSIKHLNELLEKNLDAEKGYKESAEKVDNNTQLAAFMRTSATTRGQFAQELRGEIVSLGGDPTESTSAASNLHRTWINLKDAFSGDDNEAVLEECIRGEEAALKDYDEAIKSSVLPHSSQAIVEKQRTQISEALSEVRGLKSLAD